MGPRSADRGISQIGGKLRGAGRASMGPRSADRGICRSGPRWGARSLTASMGPRSADRGNSTTRDRSARERVTASMGPRSADRGNSTVRLGRSRRSAHRASMGPRSADRGISRHSNYSIFNDLRYGLARGCDLASRCLTCHRILSYITTADQSFGSRERAAAFRIDPPLARHRVTKTGYSSNLPFQHPREQPRLDLQQPPVAHPVIEHRMRHQRVHPQLVRAKEAASGLPASTPPLARPEQSPRRSPSAC